MILVRRLYAYQTAWMLGKPNSASISKAAKISREVTVLLVF